MAPPRIYCCCNGCLNSSLKRPEMSFFKLPREQERRNEWLQLICRDDLANKKAKSYVVCEEHFHAHQILRAEHRKNLKKTAVPSLNLPDMPREVVAFTVHLHTEQGTQTEDPITSNNNVISRKRKTKSKETQLAKRIKLVGLEDKSEKQQKLIFHELCDKFLNKEFSELVKAQSKVAKGHQKNHNFMVTTEVNDQIINIIKVKVDHMTEVEKNCTLIIDMVDLKANLVYNTKEDKITGFHEVDGVQTPDPATAAMVLMLRGIVVDWKLPVGFALLSEYRNYEEIIKWIDKLMGLFLDMGLNIRSLVSDMQTDVYNLAQDRLFTTERPFYSHRRKKMFYIYDTPSLMKMLRDSLLANEFNFQGHVANSQPIQQFYNQDREKTCRLAPKLTRSHLNPDSNEKNDLHLALDLLSNSVAAGILTYIDFYIIDESGRDTVKVIKLMNDLYDLLNSIKVQDKNVFKKAFCGDPAQIHVFNEGINFFRTLKLVDPSGRDVTSSAKFIEGFLVTISSIMLMLEDFGRKGIQFLRTRRLNKSATQKLFEQIRTLNGITEDPTSRQFILGYHEVFIKELMKPTAGKDCTAELAKLLTAYTETENQPEDKEDPNNTGAFSIDEPGNELTVKSSEYSQIAIPVSLHAVVYLSSYLLKRCYEKHEGCQILKSYVVPTLEQRTQNFCGDGRYQWYRKFSRETSSCLMVVPRDDFIKYVEMMEIELHNSFKKKHVDKDIAASIYKKISELSFAPPCPCFPIGYLKKLFLRMRIFHTIQFNNKTLRAGGAKRRYFSVPELASA